MHSALALSLSPEQFKGMVDYAVGRIEQIDGERRGEKRWADMERWEKMAASDYSHRLTSQGCATTIFDKSNTPLQSVRSAKAFILARLTKDLFGTSPWFSAQPEGSADKPLIEQIQPHADWKLRQANYKQKGREILDAVLDLGWCPVKTTWKKEEDTSERLAVVLTDKATGEPLLTPAGDYIFDDDESAEEPILDDAGNPALGMDGQPAALTGFPKAPGLYLDQMAHEWREQLITENITLYAGLEISVCNWKDVGWSTNAETLEAADFVYHRTSARPSELRARFAPESFTQAIVTEGAEGAAPDWQDVLETIDQIAKGGDRAPKTEGEMAKPEYGENDVRTGDDDDEPVEIFECYFDYDCFQDGKKRRLWAAVDKGCGKAVWADYRASMSPRAQKPLHIVAINKVRGRAYGRGLYEVHEHPMDAGDKLLNAIIYHTTYTSDPAKIFNSQLTIEGKKNPNLQLGPGLTMTPDSPQTRAEDILKIIELPDRDNRNWELMNLFMQLIQVESGVTNAAQSAVSGLPQNDLATGINALTEISSLLHQAVLEEIRGTLTPELSYAIELLYFRQDTDETYQYLEGKAQAVLELRNAKALRQMAMNVEILLTRAKKVEEREAAMAAIPMGAQFSQLPPDVQLRMKPAFLQLFRALGFDHPDEFFPDSEELAFAVLQMLQMQGWLLVNPAGQVQPPPGVPGEEAPVEGEAPAEAAAPALPANVIPEATQEVA